LEFLFILGFVVLITAAVILRRRINDPASTLGRWWARSVQSWYERHAGSPLQLGFKIIVYLTAILWLVIFVSSWGDEREGKRELFEGTFPADRSDEKK